MKSLEPEERIVIAADFVPSDEALAKNKGREEVTEKVIALARELRDTGVYLKVNSALRAGGYDMLQAIRAEGLKCFADLKLFDIPETLKTDGKLLREASPELLTVVCPAGAASLKALKKELPNVEVLSVAVLTTLSEADAELIYGCSIEVAARRFATIARNSHLDGLIGAPKEARAMREVIGDEMSFNAAGVRPAWGIVPGDDQNPERIMTIKKGKAEGVTRFIIGRPVLQAKDRRAATMRTIEEVAAP